MELGWLSICITNYKGKIPTCMHIKGVLRLFLSSLEHWMTDMTIKRKRKRK